MAKNHSELDKMRENPSDNWTIAKVKKLCKLLDVEVRKPKRGSHHVVVSPHLRDVLTVPYNRPIKTLYIKKLVSYLDAHIACSKGRKND